MATSVGSKDVMRTRWSIPRIAILRITGVLIIAAGLAMLPMSVRPLGLLLCLGLLGLLSYHFGNNILVLLTAAFFVRVVAILVDRKLGVLPRPGIAHSHHSNAKIVATELINGGSLSHLHVLGVDSVRGGVAVLLAPFYVVFGSSPVSGRIAIAFFSIFIGVFIYLVTRDVASRRVALVTAFITLFWPSVFYRSIVLQREAILAAVMIAILWVGFQWLDRISVGTAVIAVIGVMLLIAFRKENLILVAATLGTAIMLRGFRERSYFIYGAVLVVPVLLLGGMNFGTITGYGEGISPAAIDAFAHGRAHGDAVYLEDLHYRTWIDIVLLAPIKALYFLYSPFPWHIRTITELVVGFTAWVLLIMTFAARRGLSLMKNSSGYRGILLSYLLMGVTTYSIIEMNYGAAVRRRIQFVPLIIILATISASNLRVRYGRRASTEGTEIKRHTESE